MGEKFSADSEELIKLKNELIMAEKLVEDKLKPQMRSAMERYTSRYIPMIARDWDVVVNEVYSIIQYELPSIYYRNPRVFLKPRNKNYFYKKRNPITGQMEEVTGESSKSAKTQEAILNYTLSEIGYKREIQRCLLDALLFKHGVLWHGYKGEFGMTEEQSLYIQNEQVFVKRVSPMMFLFDPSVTLATLDEANWLGRSFDVPLQDLLDDPELDTDKSLKGDLGYGITLESDRPTPLANGGLDTRNVSSRTRTLLDYTDDQYRRLIGSQFVKVYEIFHRPTKKEKREGKKGKVVLYTKAQRKPLRVSDWPYKVDSWPAKVIMFNEVPDSIFGVSDIEIWGEQTDQKNVILNLQLRNAQENSKNVVLFDKSGLDEETVQKVERGDQSIIGVDGPVTGKIAFASPSQAVSSELYQIDQRIQNNIDKTSGVVDIRQGILRSGEESATSAQIRASGASLRPVFRQDIMTDFLKESVLFINHLLKQFMPVQDAVRISGSLDIEWSDDPSKEDLQADVDVEIDVISMQPENPDKELQENMQILQLMTQAVNDPAMMQKIAQEGYTFNFGPVIENLLLRLKVRNPDVFRHLKPEESQGFAPVAELKAAQANVMAAITGKQPPSPPAEGQDHASRLEIYQAMQQLFKMMQHESDILNQLIMMQSALQQQEAEKQTPNTGAKAPIKLGKASIKQPNLVGAK